MRPGVNALATEVPIKTLSKEAAVRSTVASAVSRSSSFDPPLAWPSPALVRKKRCNALARQRTVLVDEIVRSAHASPRGVPERIHMMRMITRLVVPSMLALGSVGLGFVAAGPANAASTSHATTATKTWHGKVVKLDAKMGMTEAFTMTVGTKTFVVHYDSMTHWVMGTAKDIKIGVLVTVTGTLNGATIAAARLSA
jgi:hypothetical protein